MARIMSDEREVRLRRVRSSARIDAMPLAEGLKLATLRLQLRRPCRRRADESAEQHAPHEAADGTVAELAVYCGTLQG